jgi:hypothetical protein
VTFYVVLAGIVVLLVLFGWWVFAPREGEDEEPFRWM